MTADWIRRLEQTADGRRLMEQERLIVEVAETLSRLMDEHGISRAELARQLGKTPAFVTKLLSGENNFTLRTLSDIAFAMERSIHFSLGELGEGVLLCPVTLDPQVSLSLSGWSSKGRGRWPQLRATEASDTSDGKEIAA